MSCRRVECPIISLLDTLQFGLYTDEPQEGKEGCKEKNNVNGKYINIFSFYLLHFLHFFSFSKKK